MNNLEEMDRFLEKFNLSRLNQEEISIQLQELKLKNKKKIKISSNESNERNTNKD